MFYAQSTSEWLGEGCGKPVLGVCPWSIAYTKTSRLPVNQGALYVAMSQQFIDILLSASAVKDSAKGRDGDTLTAVARWGGSGRERDANDRFTVTLSGGLRASNRTHVKSVEHVRCTRSSVGVQFS